MDRNSMLSRHDDDMLSPRDEIFNGLSLYTLSSAGDLHHEQSARGLDSLESPNSLSSSSTPPRDQLKHGRCRQYENISNHRESMDISEAPISILILNTEKPSQDHDRGQSTSTEKPAGEKVASLDPESCSQEVTTTTSRSILKTWWPEILSTLLAIGCLWSVIAVLYVYQDRPLPNWPPDILSINSLISILSAFFKTALMMPVSEGIDQLKWNWLSRPGKLSEVAMFDGASRGLWGSLWFLVKQVPRTNHSFLASLGAFITIAALAIDPFTQALVEHTVCRRVMDIELAQTPRTNVYSTYNNDNQDRARAAESKLDSSMQVALYKGLLDPHNTSSLLDFSCARGNCTFGSKGDGGFFSSLAMCHSCEDISSSVTGNGSVASPWSLSNDVVLGSNVVLVSEPQGGSGRLFQYVTLMRNFWRDEESAFAVKCSLQPCVKTYSAVVNNSKYEEFDEDEPVWLRGDEHSPENQVAFSHVSDHSLIGGTRRECKPSHSANLTGSFSVMVDAKTKLLGYSDRGEDVDWVYYPRECVWTVDINSHFAIYNALDRLMRSNVTLDVGGGGFENVNGDAWLLKLYSKGRGNMTVANDLMKGLAASMTAAMRNHPFDEASRLWDRNGDLSVTNGTAYEVTTCVDVNWPWITYPAIILLLQLVFCALILATRQWAARDDAWLSRRPDWKSWALTLMVEGLGGDYQGKMEPVDTVRQMAEVSSRANVRLCRVHADDEAVWQFCES